MQERQLWFQMAYASERGCKINRQIKKAILEKKATPSSYDEIMATIEPVYQERKRQGHIIEADIYYDGYSAGMSEKAVEQIANDNKERGTLIPSPPQYIKQETRRGVQQYNTRSSIETSQPYQGEMYPLKRRRPYIPPEMVPEGLLPDKGSINSSPQSWSARVGTDSALTVAELWFEGIKSQIPEHEIAQRVKAGIRRGLLNPSTPQDIVSAINQARAFLNNPGRDWGVTELALLNKPQTKNPPVRRGGKTLVTTSTGMKPIDRAPLRAEEVPVPATRPNHSAFINKVLQKKSIVPSTRWVRTPSPALDGVWDEPAKKAEKISIGVGVGASFVIPFAVAKMFGLSNTFATVAGGVVGAASTIYTLLAFKEGSHPTQK